MTFRPHFTHSEASKSLKAFDYMVKTYGQSTIDQASHVIALGGDGHLLRVLHDFIDLNIPIFGMNKGTLGFLMNDFKEDHLEERVLQAQPLKLYPLHVELHDTQGKIRYGLAFNEAHTIRSVSQASRLKISVDGQMRLPQLVCDGILLATPAGSTAYNRACHGPILPMRSHSLALTPINPFSPRWNGAILPNSAIVEVENLNPLSRPSLAALDFLEFPYTAYLKIQQSKQQYAQLLFDPDSHLEHRVLTQQFDSLTAG